MPHGNVASQATFMPSRQLRTLQRILCLMATSHLKRLYAFEATAHLKRPSLCLKGNFAPYSESYASRQCRTSSDLYAFEATSHFKRPLCSRGNFALQATFMLSKQLRTSSDLYALEATLHLKRPLCLMATSHLKRLYAFEATAHLKRPSLCLKGNFALYSESYASRQCRTSSDLYAFEATSNLTANIMPHGNVVPQATFMPSRQLGTSSNLMPLRQLGTSNDLFCLRGNFAPCNQSYTSRQCLALPRSPCLMTTL